MEIEKVIFVLLILVGIITLILSVSLIVREDTNFLVSNLNENNFNLSSEYIGTYYPGYSRGGVVLSSQVNARNYCRG